MAPVESPFHLSPEHVLLLRANKDFNVLHRTTSQSQSHSFCSTHAALPRPTKDTFILHTTLLNTLISPLINLHNIASTLATHHLTLHPRRKSSTPAPEAESDFSSKSPPSSASTLPTSPEPAPSDLELAFRGSSRSSFSWLTCLTLGERSWCSTNGCPSCIILKIFEAEPYLRAVIAGTRLSPVFQNFPFIRGSAKGLDTSFFLPTLQAAVAEDEFWGRDFWLDISTRAADFEGGVRDLIKECQALGQVYPDAILSQLPSDATTSRPKDPSRSLSVSFVTSPRTRYTNFINPTSNAPGFSASIALKRGASRRQRLPPVRVRIVEEPSTGATQEWVSRLVKAVFGKETMMHSDQRLVEKDLIREGMKMKRKRSLTA